ncbi:MAG: tetratricopeptide repeat protein [Candidatus Zapsychrus exili]|nr:tetratricopeptide repeat protein [Candidatus Zapsychrus exili]
MLNANNIRKKSIRILFSFLLFISLVTFHSKVLANTALDTAKDYRAKGYEAQKRGNIDEALAYYVKALTLGTGTENAVAYNDLGVLYEEAELNQRAEECYLRAIYINKDYLPAYSNLAYFYKKLGQLEKAYKYFKIRYESGDPNDKWTQKVRYEILKIRPEYQEVIYSRQREEIESQVVALSEELSARIKEDLETKLQHSSEHFRKSNEYLEQGAYDKAAAELRSALKITPQNPKVVKAIEAVEKERIRSKIREQFKQVEEKLDEGDLNSARKEAQEILSIISEESSGATD